MAKKQANRAKVTRKNTNRKETEQVSISVLALRRSAVTVTLFGDSPLLVHGWSQKAKLEMLSKHMGLVAVREHKDPWEQFLGCLYHLSDGNYGFPIVAIKEAMATAAIDIKDLTKSVVYRNVFVKGQEGFEKAAFMDLLTPRELAPVYSPNPPQIREDMVRLSGMAHTPDIRYRAQFWPWAMRFQLAWHDGPLSPDSIINLLAHAGFTVGLAEWRQEKGGICGAFHACRQGDAEERQVDRWIKAGPQEPVRPDIEAWVASLREGARLREATSATAQ